MPEPSDPGPQCIEMCSEDTSYTPEIGLYEVEITEDDPVVVNSSWISLEGKKQVIERFGEGHPLVAVAQCESGFRQFNDDGSLLVNPAPDSSATRIFQILHITHGPHALSMGMDITTPEGNMDYAEYLYNQNGLRDWEESRHCWEKLI